jgi:soluble lytic murein transglycosylase-like protein
MTLEDIITSESLNIGPLPKTGGVIHQLNASQVLQVAALIRAASKKYGVPLAILAGWLCVESRFDPHAVNPNNQNAKPGDDAYAIYKRTDYGIAQVDGRYMSDWFKGMAYTWQQMSERAMDPVWAVDAFGSRAADLLKQYQGNNIDAFEAYNVGSAGETEMIKEGEPLVYGERVQSFVDKFTGLGIE